jgi:circadian clock protein KaiC
MQKRDILTERCPTGILGFDNLCNGGFVRNSVNVIRGDSGSGKTTFLLQFLWNGVNTYKENGLYLSFEPDIMEVFQDANSFGWDFQRLEDNGSCRFLKLSPDTEPAELKKQLMAEISKHEIKRVCLDPVSLFLSNEKDTFKLRKLLFDLTSMLRRFGVTVLLSDELEEASAEEQVTMDSNSRSQYIKFLVGGVINFYSSGLGGVSDRAVRIVKMRRTNHARGPVPMRITDNGIVVNPKA